ncbi:MAG: hypothetical protein IJS15_11475, partial [Victivallales bacterium]|nr:hypothetical protein [Victivallales bacterium]
AAHLGMEASFIGVVGDDDAGKCIVRELEAERIDTSAMKIRRGENSSIAYCWVDKGTGKRSIAWSHGSGAELGEDEIDFGLIRTAAILHLDGHNPKGALAAAKEARRCGIPVSLDAGTMRDGIAEILPYVTILIASESFARRFSGERKLENALLRLKEAGAEVAGITMGKEGSMALDNGRIIRCPAFRIDAVDTTGAGDVFHGAFCVRYLETHDIQESMKFASAVSALKCLQFGGRTGIPDRRKVDEFLNDNFK